MDSLFDWDASIMYGRCGVCGRPLAYELTEGGHWVSWCSCGASYEQPYEGGDLTAWWPDGQEIKDGY
jgi:hypothetical protein